ncbi:MAG: TIR domain-containing protein [Cyanobacteria bacterium P01_C01_bin.118]
MPQSDFFPELPDYNPEPADGVSVGESPVPGLTLKRILRGHTDWIGNISWSPDGRFLASPSGDNTICIWNVSNSECRTILKGHTNLVNSVAWSPDGRRLASASSDNTIRLWHVATGKYLQILKGHADVVISVAWSPDGKVLASSSYDTNIFLWDTASGKSLKVFNKHTREVYGVAWSPDGKVLASASEDKTIRLWEISEDMDFGSLAGHTDSVHTIEWTSNGQSLVSASGDGTIRLWDFYSGKILQILEGHAGAVNCAVLSDDGKWLVSKGRNDIRLWSRETWNCVATLQESNCPYVSSICAFHPKLPVLATFCEEDTGIRIWKISEDSLNHLSVNDSIRYTTAKVVLVGDSGVGKTGLGWRIAHNTFKEHTSTHGQQFWLIEELCKTRDDGTECEAILWDLAGQHIYRSIHSIFLDNVDASLVLFDPTNRQDPLKGAQFWLEQLKGKEQLPPSVLVGARMDRGGSTVSQDYLEQFCQQCGITGGYISTSAKSGEGLEQLIEQLKSQIPWDEMTTTVTTVTFKRIKDYVLALKEKTDRKGVLVQPAELRRQLQETDSDWEFNDAEMMTAVGHLETHGYVTILKSSEGDTHILLTPDLLVDLASSIVLQADKHPRELGAVNERELLQGVYSFDELEGLETSEQQILFDAAILRFLEHNICFRETLDNDNLLIFPGLIKQKRPLEDDFAATDDVSYIVRGRVENLYSTLVVLLGYTPSFIRINHWQKQAQYATSKNEICGFRMIEDREGEIELVLYYSDQMLAKGREQFQELFERFLYQRDVQVTRFPPVVCENGHPLERATVIARLRDNKNFAFCAECGVKVNLPNLEQTDIGTDASDWLRREEATAKLRSTYEQHLSRVKGYRRDWATPRCYLSHAPGQGSYAQKLTHDLQDAGVYIITDIAQAREDDYVLMLDTSDYRTLYQAPTSAFATDVKLIKRRLAKGKHRLLAIRLESRNPAEQHDLKGYKPGDFSDATHYPVNLFNLVLNLYAIPLNHASFRPLRESLQKQWKQTLSHLPKEEMQPEKRPLKVFISYSHKDEAFKDDLVTMLAIMERNGMIDAWQDRRIEPGAEWNEAIQTAMNECDLAILLVSKNFLASRFINDKEVPKLLQRRKDEGMRVVPVIIRPCPWTSEPVLKGLQALPRDNKAIITFAENTGERDQAWTDIAKELEKFAKELQEN